MPARTPEVMLSTASGHRSRRRARRRLARRRTKAKGAYAAIAPKQTAMGRTPTAAWTSASTSTPATTHETKSVRTDRPANPAWTTSSDSRVSGPAAAGGRRARRRHPAAPPHEEQADAEGQPQQRASHGGPLGQQRGQVVSRPLEAIRVRREPVRATELAAAPDEEVGDLDHVALHTAGHGCDLAHRATAVALERRVDDEVDGRGHGRHDEARRDVLAGEQRQRAHLRHGLAGAVRVDRAHARETGVERDEQVQALGLADLTDDDARGPHPKRLLDEAAQRDVARALQRRLPALHRGDVAVRDAQLEDLLAGHDPLASRHGRGQAVQEGRLPGLRSAGDEDVEPRGHRGLEEAGRLPGEGAQPDEVVHRVGLDDELAHVDVPVVAGDVGDDDVQPAAVGENGIDEGRGLRSTRRPEDFSIRSTRSRTWSCESRVVVSSATPLRATKTRLGSLTQISSTDGSSKYCCSGP